MQSKYMCLAYQFVTVIIQSWQGKEQNWAFLTALDKLTDVWCLELCAGTLFAEVWCCCEHYLWQWVAFWWRCLGWRLILQCIFIMQSFLRLLNLHKLAVRKLDLSRGRVTLCHSVLDHGFKLHKNIPLITASKDMFNLQSSLFNLLGSIFTVQTLLLLLPVILKDQQPNRAGCQIFRLVSPISGLNSLHQSFTDNTQNLAAFHTHTVLSEKGCRTVLIRKQAYCRVWLSVQPIFMLIAYCSVVTSKGCRNYYGSIGGSHKKGERMRGRMGGLNKDKTFTLEAADHITANSGLFKLTRTSSWVQVGNVQYLHCGTLSEYPINLLYSWSGFSSSLKIASLCLNQHNAVTYQLNRFL